MTKLSGEERILLAYEEYERRMHMALAEMPQRRPWLAEDRAAIKDWAGRLLGIRPEWIPEIRTQALRERKRDGYAVWDLSFTSWPGVIGTAHWYVPEGEAGQRPFALLFCGHGAGCKHTPGYQAMARRLARQGMVVLVPDNMGQGERAPMGHHDVMAPFDCGLTFQGMLAMEGMALLNWAVRQPGIDPARVGLLGNSGGGALSLLVGALSPLATAVAPSGYPNSFEGFLRKDKVHCACNVLPGMLGRLEMWHILSLVAPRKLFILQGQGDDLFPYETFLALGRRLRAVYAQMGAPEAFRCQAYPGAHSWDVQRRHALSAYFAEQFGLAPAEELAEDCVGLLAPEETCLPDVPKDALTADEAACRIAGKAIEPRPLWEIFPPQADLAGVDLSGGRGGDHRRVFAQYEASLSRTWGMD